MTSKIEGVSPHCNTTSLDEPDFGTDIFICPFLIFLLLYLLDTLTSLKCQLYLACLQACFRLIQMAGFY